MDNMIDAKTIRDYIKGQVGDASAKIAYGTHIEAIRYLNG